MDLASVRRILSERCTVFVKNENHFLAFSTPMCDFLGPRSRLLSSVLAGDETLRISRNVVCALLFRRQKGVEALFQD